MCHNLQIAKNSLLLERVCDIIRDNEIQYIRREKEP